MDYVIVKKNGSPLENLFGVVEKHLINEIKKGSRVPYKRDSSISSAAYRKIVCKTLTKYFKVSFRGLALEISRIKISPAESRAPVQGGKGAKNAWKSGPGVFWGSESIFLDETTNG